MNNPILTAKKILYGGTLLFLTSNQCIAADELVGSSFRCTQYGITQIYTFFPNNQYTYKIVSSVINNELPTISYQYDGKTLTLKFINVRGEQKEDIFSAIYLPKKGKLILDDGKMQRICIEK